MSKWNLMVSSGDSVSMKVLDINSCLDYLENIDQDVEIISIQQGKDNMSNGMLGDIGSYKNCNDGRRDIIEDDGSGTKTENPPIILNKQDHSNSILFGKKPLFSHRVSNMSKASSPNLSSNVVLNASVENLRNSNLGICTLDLHINPSEPLGIYQCFLCPYNFAVKNDLSKHLLKHLDRPHPYMCQACEKSFSNIYRLKAHILAWTDIRTFQCEQCDKSFTTSYNLSKHKRNSHSGMSSLKCTKCDYQTFERNDLKIHLAIHLDERPFKCKYCSYASKSQRYLTWHERTHIDDRRYKCDICYSRFGQLRSLRDHRKKHFFNSLTIHRCNFCPSELGSPDELRTHVENIHREQVLK